jgi:type I restriction enzyme S subunit
MRPLRDVLISLEQGWSPKCSDAASDDAETWAVIKTTAIQAGAFDASKNKVLPPTLVPRPALQIEAGDILITRAGPRSRVGIACYVAICRPRLLLCDKAYRLRVRPGVADAKYVGLMLNAPWLLAAIEDLKSGISDSGLNLTQDRFLSLEIPIPPLAEQRRIAARIEALFARTRRARADLERTAPLAERYRTAALVSALSGETSPAPSDVNGPAQPPADGDLAGVWPFDQIPDDWHWAPFEQLLDDNTSSHKKLPQKAYLSSGEFPVVDQGEGTVGGWSDDQGLVYNGSLPAIVFGDHTRAVKFIDRRFVQGADGVKVLVPRGNLVSARYAYWLLRGLPLPDKGYARHMKFLRASYFPLPPLVEQPGIVRRIEQDQAAADVAEREAARVLALLDRLERAILAQAFRGELVPQDPADEPTAALVARLRGGPPATGRRGRPRAGVAE